VPPSAIEKLGKRAGDENSKFQVNERDEENLERSGIVRAQGYPSIVIPGRCEASNPESRSGERKSMSRFRVHLWRNAPE